MVKNSHVLEWLSTIFNTGIRHEGADSGKNQKREIRGQNQKRDYGAHECNEARQQDFRMATI